MFSKETAWLSEQILKLKARQFSQVKIHNDWINNMAEKEICAPKEWHLDLPWLWFIFRPMWECSHKERIGEIFDGGKWHCNLKALENVAKQGGTCVAYSLGSNGQVEYEVSLQRRTGCEVHIFDPTVAEPSGLPSGIRFHKIGIAGEEGTITVGGNKFPAKPLWKIMNDLGHTHLHSLKIDIDGYEYESLDVLLERSWGGKSILSDQVDELLLEFHWKGQDIAIRAFEQILGAGFRIFSHEPNLFYITQPAAGIEYSFIHNRVARAYELQLA